MKKQVVIYGLIGGFLITVLKLAEYRFLVIEHSLEIYGGLVAGIFAVLGLWLGRKLTGKQAVNPVTVPVAQPVAAEFRKRQDIGITARELEVLGLIAQGLSNREIAGKLYVSENTVKTHSSRIFEKLGAKRRTQAVQLGKELGLIP